MGDCRIVVMVIWGLLLLISSSNSQLVPHCFDPVLPCFAYLNSTNPPDVCCNPVKQILAETKDSCFCELVSSPDGLQGYGVTTDQASRLMHLCGVSFAFTSCRASSPDFSPSLVKPPATPGSDEGGASMITFSRLYFILFIWACVLFH